MNSQSRKLILGTFFVVLQIISWTPIMSLPDGAPERVCDTMLPFHMNGILPETRLPPFRVETSTSVIGQGQTLRVDIVGVPAGLNFGGFMIQARDANPPHNLIGQFNTPRDGRSKLMNCENSVNNSATHTNAGPKTDVSLEWQSPIDFLGNVIFNSTVAQSYDSFWVGIPSEPVQVVRRSLAPAQNPTTTTTRGYSTTRTPYVPTYQAPLPAATVSDPFYDGCGVSKTCFGFPNGCVQTKTCTAIVSSIVRGEFYEFEMKTIDNTAAYVALGLSDDSKMGDDLVVECVPQNGQATIYSSYTSGSPSYGVTRVGVPQNLARLTASSIENGVIYCKVQHTPVATVLGKMYDLINNKYHLLVAAGTSVRENGVGYHSIGRLPADSPIFLSEVQSLSGASLLLVRLHGAFMIAAWIGTTSLGIILARYFKQTWVGSQTCGKDQWFAWHRMLMVTTWTLTMVAFILIFVELGAWSAERNPHAILGLVTTVLCFLQPIGALFRPAPNSSKRPIFNWIHWLGGNVAHILAIVTIFFSVQLTKAELPEWMDWILVGFVVFHVVVHLIFSVAGCSADREQSQHVNTFQMGDIGHQGGRNSMKLERKMDAPYAGFRKGLLAVYSVVLVLFVVALILVVVLAPIEEHFKTV